MKWKGWLLMTSAIPESDPMTEIESLETQLSQNPQDAALFSQWLLLASRTRGDLYVRGRAPEVADVQSDPGGHWVAYLLQNAYYDEAWNLTLKLYTERPDDPQICTLLLMRAMWLGRARASLDIARDIMARGNVTLMPLMANFLVAAGEFAQARLVLDRFLAEEHVGNQQLIENALFAAGWIANYEGRKEDAGDAMRRLSALRYDRSRLEVSRIDVDALLAQAADPTDAEFCRTAIRLLSACDLPARDVPFLADLAARLFEAVAASLAEQCGRATPAPPYTAINAMADEAIPVLAGLGLSPIFVRLSACESNFVESFDYHGQGNWAAAEVPPPGCKDFYYGRLATEHAKGVFRPVAMSRRALARKKIKCVCPWTGKALESDESYVVGHDVLYRFEGLMPFYLLCVGLFPNRDGLYIPGLNIVIRLQSSMPEDYLVNIARHIDTVVTPAAAMRDAEGAAARRCALLFGLTDNMGHHYMNELAAIERVVEQGHVPPGTALIVGPHDFYDVERLYPDSFAAIHRCGAIGEARLLAQRENLFVLRLHDVAAYASLSARVRRHAAEVARHAGQDMAAVLAAHTPVVLFTLRRVRRAWRSQEQGIVAIMRRLEARYPTICFVFDGMTATGMTAMEKEWTEKDQAIFDSIDRMASVLNVRARRHSIIGRTVYEKMRAYERVSVAVVPKGNGHVPNLAWIMNVPSVVHGNSWNIRETFWETQLREGVVMPRLIDRAATIDILRTETGTPQSYRQYTVDYDISFEAICGTIESVLLDTARSH